MKKTKWTKEEDEIIVQAVKDSPHNKSEAFRNAAEKLNKKVSSCQNRWYKHLSNPESKYYVGCMFTMIGIHSRYDNKTVNRTNVKITPVKSTRTIWQRIKTFLKLK